MAKRVLIMSTDVGAGNELGSAIFASRDDGDSWRELTRTGWQSKNYAVDGTTSRLDCWDSRPRGKTKRWFIDCLWSLQKYQRVRSHEQVG